MWVVMSHTRIRCKNTNKCQSQYGDNSGWTGRVIQDSVSIGGSPAVPVLFATIDHQSNNFLNPGTFSNPQSSSFINQGIIGFAYPSLSVSTTNTYNDG